MELGAPRVFTQTQPEGKLGGTQKFAEGSGAILPRGRTQPPVSPPQGPDRKKNSLLKQSAPSSGASTHVSALTPGPSGRGTHVSAPTPGPSGRGTTSAPALDTGDTSARRCWAPQDARPRQLQRWTRETHQRADTGPFRKPDARVSAPMPGSSASGKTPAIAPRREPTGEHGAFSSGARLPRPRRHRRVTDSRHTLSADGTAAPAVSSSSQPLLHNQRPTLRGLPVTQVRDLL